MSEKHVEISRELIDEVIEFMNEKVGASEHNFFQLMDDVVIPVLEECLSQDVIDDKHLKQHLDELKLKNGMMADLGDQIDEMEYNLNEMKHLIQDK